MSDVPDITVSIRCVNDSIPQFRECIDALLAQEGVTCETWIIDSSDHEEFKGICAEYDSVHYCRIPGKNLCEGRNKGIELSRSDYVALTDPDCVPCPIWLKSLKEQLDAGAGVVGGQIVPRWLAKPPYYIRESKMARAHLSLRSLGTDVREVDRVFGANIAFSKSALGEEAKFREDLDRVNGILIGGGDTEFCERASALAGSKIVYVPDASVEHQIPPRRLSFGWTLKRAFYGGVSRTWRGGRPSPVKGGTGLSLADMIFGGLFVVPYMVGQLYGVRLKKKGLGSAIGTPEFNERVDAP